MTDLGTIVYSGSGLVLPVDKIELTNGTILFFSTIVTPQRRIYNFGGWMHITGRDGITIVGPVELSPCIIDNRHDQNSTITVYQPVQFSCHGYTGGPHPFFPNSEKPLDWDELEPLFKEIEEEYGDLPPL